MFDLMGKRALVTGASGGLGQEIARALYQQGASVAVSGTRVDVLDQLATNLGERAFCIPCNLADKDGVEALVPKAEALMGGVDILINNAGVTKDNLFMRLKDADWQEVMDINLTSAFRLSRAVLRSMMKQRFGRIISISSVVGVTGNPGQGNYAASKAALIGMSKALASEVASRQITVNCIAPGFIQSPMTDALDEKQRSVILTKVPGGRLGLASEIGAACVYLASHEAAYVTGQTLHINGGMAMI